MTAAPVAFISYSHDSSPHKQWVAEFASRLRHNGVDVILDQWDLPPGGDAARFMEEGVSGASRVLVICTPEYVRKANEGTGGVGYEKLIITAELVQNLGSTKFIPIIRQGDGPGPTTKPKFLGTRIHIDQRDGSLVEEEFEKLLRELHQAPAVSKPPLGKNPFGVTPSGAEAALGRDQTLVSLPVSIAEPGDVYRKAIELARHDDNLGWRILTKNIRRPAFEGLAAWSNAFLKTGVPAEKEKAEEALQEALRPLMPLIAQALAGVESGREALKNQKSILDEFFHPPGWPSTGPSTLVEFPRTLAYVYQALHGATCAYTGQLELAVALVEMKVHLRYEGKYTPLWRDHGLVGWPGTFGRESLFPAWAFLLSLPERFPWLLEIFEDSRQFRTALSAYYMALNVFELAWTIKNEPAVLSSKSVRPDVPPMFFFTHQDLDGEPLRLLARKPEEVRRLWLRMGVTDEQFRKAWPVWVEHMKGWMAMLHRFWMSEAPHERLLESIQS